MLRVPLRSAIAPLVPALLLATPVVAVPIQHAATQSAETMEPPPPYADVADLVMKSQVIADVTIRSADKIKEAAPQAATQGPVRLLVTADVNSLLRGPAALPPRIEYVITVQPGPKGQLPRLKKEHMLLFARPVTGLANQLQLTGPTSNQRWTPALDALARGITTAVISPSAPPEVTGVGHAFFVPGALPGEGETQIFLKTADNRPVSLSVQSKPGEPKRWAVALSEIVDQAAAPPPRDTLLWYRLACFLPRDLPDESVADSDADSAAAAREDYHFVLTALGPCGRTRPADAP